MITAIAKRTTKNRNKRGDILAYNMFKNDGIIYKYGAGTLEVIGFADKKDDRVLLNIPATLFVTYAGRHMNVKVTEIANNAFQDSIHLIQVHIPETVERIGERAFANCINLREVYSNAAAEPIGISRAAFQGCLNLRDVKMTRSVTYLSCEAFADCYSLENINMPLKAVNNYAFKNCTSLKRIFLDEDGVLHNNTVEKTSIEDIYLHGDLKEMCSGVAKWIRKKGISLSCHPDSNVCELVCEGYNVVIF